MNCESLGLVLAISTSFLFDWLELAASAAAVIDAAADEAADLFVTFFSVPVVGSSMLLVTRLFHITPGLFPLLVLKYVRWSGCWNFKTSGNFFCSFSHVRIAYRLLFLYSRIHAFCWCFGVSRCLSGTVSPGGTRTRYAVNTHLGFTIISFSIEKRGEQTTDRRLSQIVTSNSNEYQ